MNSRKQSTSDDKLEYFRAVDPSFKPSKAKVPLMPEAEVVTSKKRSARKAGKPKKTASCFVLMPFDGLTDVYNAVVLAWQEAFGKKAVIKHQGKDKRRGGKETIDKKILKNIQGHTFTVSILSMGKKERALYKKIVGTKGDKKLLSKCYPINANVWFETGYAMAATLDDKSEIEEVFYIADDQGKNSVCSFIRNGVFDLRNRDIIDYDPARLSELTKTLTEVFSQAKKDHGF